MNINKNVCLCYYSAQLVVILKNVEGNQSASTLRFWASPGGAASSDVKIMRSMAIQFRPGGGELYSKAASGAVDSGRASSPPGAGRCSSLAAILLLA